MTLLQLLEQALEKEGLSKEYANHLAIEDESNIEGVVSSIKKLQPRPTTDFEELMQSNPDFTKEVDRRISKAISTYKEKNQITATTKHKKPTESNDDSVDPNKALLEMMEKMNNRLDGIEKGKVVAAKKQNAVNAFKSSKLPESLQERWLNRIDLDSDVSFEDQVKDLDKEYQDHIQSEVNNNVSSKGFLSGGTQPQGTLSDEQLKSIIN